ncbi:MAG: hypothetical protein AAGB00_00765 [Planctomycetota bacterium]
MIKKSLITVLSVTLVGGLLFGSSAFSYLKTACNRVSQAAEDSVSVDFQIDRARDMVADLSPEVKRSMTVIAQEEVELQSLDERIAKAEARAVKGKSEILRLQADLNDGRHVFRYASRTYTRDQVTEDLSRRFTRFKVDDETLTHLKSMRDARARNLDAARQKLTAMMSAQKKLETDITNLEAKRKLVAVAQASSDVVIDDSRLARAKELISGIRTKLDVAAKLANADVDVRAEIPLDDAQSDDVTEQVAAYFELNTPAIDVKVANVSVAHE